MKTIRRIKLLLLSISLLLLIFTAWNKLAAQQDGRWTVPQRVRDSTTSTYYPIKYLVYKDTLKAYVYRAQSGDQFAIMQRVHGVGRAGDSLTFSGVAAMNKTNDTIKANVAAYADGHVKILTTAGHPIIINNAFQPTDTLAYLSDIIGGSWSDTSQVIRDSLNVLRDTVYVIKQLTDKLRIINTGEGEQLQFRRALGFYAPYTDSLLNWVGGSGIQHFPHSQWATCPYNERTTWNVNQATDMTDYVDPAFVWVEGYMVAPTYGTNSQATDTIVMNFQANVTRLLTSRTKSEVNLWLDFYVTRPAYGVKQWIPVAYLTGATPGQYIRPTAVNQTMSGPWAPYAWLPNGYSGYHHSWWVYGVASGDTLHYRLRRWHTEYQTDDFDCDGHWYYGYYNPFPDAGTISHSYLAPLDSVNLRRGTYYVRLWSNVKYQRTDSIFSGWETVTDTTLGGFADSTKSGILKWNHWDAFYKKLGRADSVLYYTSLNRFRDSLAQTVKKRDSTLYATSNKLFRWSVNSGSYQRDSLNLVNGWGVNILRSGYMASFGADTGTGKLVTQNRFIDSTNQTVKKRDSSYYVTKPLWADSLDKLIRVRDSNTVYTTPEYVRTHGGMDSTLMMSVEANRLRDVAKADSGIVYASYPAFRDSLSEVLKLRDSTIYATWPRLRDSSAVFVKLRDSTLYATSTRLRDSSAVALKQRDSSLYTTKPLWADSLSKLVRVRDTNSVFYSYERTRDSLDAIRGSINGKQATTYHETKQNLIDSLNGASPGDIALTRKVSITKTTEQLRLAYDVNNYWPVFVNNTGLVTMTPVSSGATPGANPRGVLGNVIWGTWPAYGTTYAFFGHNGLDQTSVYNYAFMGDNTGNTFFNASSGKTLWFRIANSNVATMTTTRLSVVGGALSSDTLRCGDWSVYTYFIPGGALVQSSDESLKNNITDYQADLSKFSLVKPKTYKFKKELFLHKFDRKALGESLSAKGKDSVEVDFYTKNLADAERLSQITYRGFLANEFNPQILGKDSKEINQQDIINVLWLKVQELESRIEKLEKKATVTDSTFTVKRTK